ncbi:MAG TPA: TOBE domain-containing protein, partial [Burkholderiales bacterium]|nr:TOBE domain-containing protein [Burkholderiales bacterium]
YIASSFGPCNFLARINLGANLGADLGATLESDHGGNPTAATWRGIEPADQAQSEVWIRPEDLRLSRAADDAALGSGVVVRSLFHGESRMVTLECRSPAGERFNVQVRQHGELDAATGDRLHILPA